MATAQRISENIAYHSSLLRTISELSHSPKALTKHRKHRQELEKRRDETKGEVDALADSTKKARAEFKKVNGGGLQRFVAKVRGKEAEGKEEKEKTEKVYVEALEKEMKERHNLQVLDDLVKDAKREETSLQAKVDDLNRSKTALDELYKKVFDGRTEDFPQDDELEAAVSQATEAVTRIQDLLTPELDALSLLAKSEKKITDACAQLRIAEIESKNPRGKQLTAASAFGGMLYVNRREAAGVALATKYATHGQKLLDEARKSSSHVNKVDRLLVPRICVTSEYPGISEDTQGEINQALTTLTTAHTALKHELRECEKRCRHLESNELREAKEVLEQEVEALNRFRRSVFEKVASAGPGEGAGEGEVDTPAPPYS